MSLIKTIILGIIQGAAEFLPISSSGHLIIFQNFMDLEVDIFYDVLLHLGTLLAVFMVYYKTIIKLLAEFFSMIKDIFTGKFSYKNSNAYRRMVIFLIIALIPLLVIYPLVSTVEKIFESMLAVGFLLLVTAALLFLSDRVVTGRKAKTSDSMTLSDAIVIGVTQAIAVLPGLSRSGSTISAGLFRGLDRETAMEFSFILSMPAVLGAAAVTFRKAEIVSGDLPFYLIGMVAATVSGFFAIKLIRFLMKKGKFGFFALYCAAMGIFAIIYDLVQGV